MLSMNEQFLQFVWKHALFEPREGKASNGEYIIVRELGQENTDAGPDFSNARILIDGTLWVGNVEIHTRSSDWYRHGHDKDPEYNNVILHAVYECDRETYTSSGRLVPAFVIQTSPGLYQQYYILMNNREWIPCACQIPRVDPLGMEIWMQELLNERMERKSESIKQALEFSRGNWEEVFYAKLMRGFGNPVNAEPFERLANSLPLNILLRHRENLFQVESLLFGQAGWLAEDLSDARFLELKEEYNYLAAKYSLKPLPAHTWHFARLRPVHFPTIRLSQFANLICSRENLFRLLLNISETKGIYEILRVSPSPYWLDHYRFGSPAPARKKQTGDTFIQSLLNNVIIPFKYAYAAFSGNTEGEKQAVNFLTQQPPENNRITRNWVRLGLSNDHAAASQALIHLKKEYCTFKKCLNCQIGRMILSL